MGWIENVMIWAALRGWVQWNVKCRTMCWFGDLEIWRCDDYRHVIARNVRDLFGRNEKVALTRQSFSPRS